MTNSPKRKFKNFITTHWHGDQALDKSFWLNLIFISWFAIGLLAYALLRGASSFLLAMEIKNFQFMIMIALVIHYAIKTAALTWGIIGAWRSANNYIELYSSSAIRKIGSLTKVVIVVLLLLWIVGMVATALAFTDIFEDYV